LAKDTAQGGGLWGGVRPARDVWFVVTEGKLLSRGCVSLRRTAPSSAWLVQFALGSVHPTQSMAAVIQIWGSGSVSGRGAGASKLLGSLPGSGSLPFPLIRD